MKILTLLSAGSSDANTLVPIIVAIITTVLAIVLVMMYVCFRICGHRRNCGMLYQLSGITSNS